jgi:predicted kinase
MTKTLYIVRGVPGSGKSTFAKSLGCPVFEADQYFIDSETGEYKFDPSKIKLAHGWCKLRVEHSMEDGLDKIAISNTFTQEWEMEAYTQLAKEFEYMVFIVIVENRHGGINQHGVPAEAIQKMKDRFNINL